MLSSASRLRALYLNVGAGGAVAGLTQAGFDAQLAVEPDRYAASTLRRAGRSRDSYRYVPCRD